ncbi:YraN family protein [Pollutibacter soli]|uniref:YraN family protein n=1 Tax=Pollutibacter soli TaxID=3034157 RepID=UPI003013EFCA
MAKHNDTGKEGEELAATWLQSNGFEIVKRNWRHFRYEIDIIASKKNCIHFIEVKTRKSKAYGFPEEQVSKSKLKQMVASGAEYLYQFGSWDSVRYDILAINIREPESEFLFIEDVYC